MDRNERSYLLSKNRRELRILLKIAQGKDDTEQAVRIQEYLDGYPKNHPLEIEEEAERKRERRETIRGQKIWMWIHPAFKSLWVVLLISVAVLLTINFRMDGNVLGKQGAGHELVTIRQVLILLAMGVGGFTLALDEYFKGPGRGYSLHAFRNGCLMITGFMIILAALRVIIRFDL